MNGTIIVRSTSATDRGDPFSCEVDVKDGGVRPLRPQQGQGCTDVCRGAEHLEAVVEFHNEKEFIFDN
jgi:hypothetical protein